MYSIDGVPLQNPTLGWRLKRASEPRVGRSFSRADFNAANRDGTLSVRGSVSTPTFTLVVQAPSSSFEALRLLMRAGANVSLTSDPSKQIAVEAMTLTPRTVTPAGPGLYELTVVYRCPGVWWRDVNTTDWTTTIGTSGGSGAGSMQVLTNSSAPVQDHIIGLVGDALNFRVAGQSSTYIEIAGRWSTGSAQAHINAVQGRAWIIPNGSDVMTGAASSEITGQLQTGAFPYFLESAPGSTGPGSALTLSWDAIYSALTVTVRARNAYDL